MLSVISVTDSSGAEGFKTRQFFHLPSKTLAFSMDIDIDISVPLNTRNSYWIAWKWCGDWPELCVQVTMQSANKNKPLQYTCVILDDEQMAVTVLEHYISRIPQIKLIGAFTDASLAVAGLLEVGKVDFLFSDIKMPVSGIQIARKIREYVHYLIFTTAYTDYALDAFSVYADHYLIKPIDFDTFLKAINQVLKKNGQAEVTSSSLSILNENNR